MLHGVQPQVRPRLIRLGFHVDSGTIPERFCYDSDTIPPRFRKPFRVKSA